MNVVLCGYYGFGNGGDEALLATLLQMLPKHVTPIVLSGNPTATQQAYGVPAIDRWNLPLVIQTLRQSECLILGGGSLLQDVTSPRSLLYYGGVLGMAQRIGIKTIAWSQGIGPLKALWSQSFVRGLLKGCTWVSIRDRNSAQILTHWGVKYTQTVDPVWALTAHTVTLPVDLPRPWGAVVLRPYPALTPARLRVLTEALGQFQRSTETSLILVPFQLPADLALAQQIQKNLSGPTHILERTDPRQLKGVFRQVEWTLGMRLHGVLMAASEGCPVWGLSYDPKVSQLLQEIHAPGLDLNQLPTQPSALVQMWLEDFANSQGLTEAQRLWWMDRAQINEQILIEALS